MAEKFDNLEEHLEKFIENIRQLGIIVSDFQPSSQAGLNQKLWVMFCWAGSHGRYQTLREYKLIRFLFFYFYSSEISWSLVYKTSRSAVSSSMRLTYRWRSLSESCTLCCCSSQAASTLLCLCLYTRDFITVLHIYTHILLCWDKRPTCYPVGKLLQSPLENLTTKHVIPRPQNSLCHILHIDFYLLISVSYLIFGIPYSKKNSLTY